MLDDLLKNQVRNDHQMAGMLTKYNGKPAFFYQKSPMDTDAHWGVPGSFPRVDYSIDMRYDPERKVSGNMVINVWCNVANKYMPEDIEKRLLELINGTFYTKEITIAAVWNHSEAFNYSMPQNVGGNTSPEVVGITIFFDLMEFPEQLTTDPNPIQALNHWTKRFFPDMTVITMDTPPSVRKPTDKTPAVYWRFEGMGATDKQSYAVNWYTGQFAAHVIAKSITERNRWTKAIIEQIQLNGEVILIDGSPMFVKRIEIRHGADPLREGQIALIGQYGVLAQHRKESAQNPLNRAIYPKFRVEVKENGKAK